jgi:hypothetical protein
MRAMQIAIITTGGTIDKVYFDAKGGYEVGAPMVRQILELGRVTAKIPILELLRKDSLEMTAADRRGRRAYRRDSRHRHHGRDRTRVAGPAGQNHCIDRRLATGALCR